VIELDLPDLTGFILAQSVPARVQAIQIGGNTPLFAWQK
jgi:hypothetical protein